MKRKAAHESFVLISFVFLLSVSSCIKRVNVPLRNEHQQLVVEASITTEKNSAKVRLSYSGNFTGIYQDTLIQFVNDASVSIRNATGDSLSCTFAGNGTYLGLDSSFLATKGNTYTLQIHLADGTHYVSDPETIKPVPPIDSLTISMDSSIDLNHHPPRYVIGVNVKDPPGERNFYRWSANGYAMRLATGVPCGFFCIYGIYCNMLFRNDSLNVLSDKLFNGNEIVNHPVDYSPIYWYGTHYIEIQQYSITEAAMNFYTSYLEQANRNGSILDPLPGPIPGNIHLVSDSTVFALGFFSASDIVRNKYRIVPYNLEKYWLDNFYHDFIFEGDCKLIYPNAFYDDPPPGWENAQRIEIH